MRVELWQRISDLFDAALERPVGERQAYLQQSCANDPELLDHVARLLREFEQAGDFLEKPLFGSERTFSSGAIVAGRYRVEALLGRGGMGEVYRAYDALVEERVALKVLQRDLGADPAFVQRFRREVQLARKVTHPSVCRVFEAGVHDAANGRPVHFFAMQLLDGETLAARIRRGGPLPREEALARAAEMAEALDAAHAAGIVHRDFKSANVMLCADRAVVMDFGLARSALAEARRQEAGGSITVAAQVAGTIAYMSPEQLSGGAVTTATDIYSFGVVLFEMATARLPFNDQHIIRSAMQRVSADEPDVQAMAPELDRRWATVIARCLRPDPARRFASAGAVVEELRGGSWQPPLPAWNRRQWAKAALGAVASAGAVALIPAAFRLFPRDVKLPEGAAVLLASVANSTGDPRFDGITELLRNQLAQSVHLTLIDADELAGALEQMGAAPRTTDPAAVREAAWRLNAALSVFGSVARIGHDYVLNVQLETRGSQPDNPRSKSLRSFSAPDPAALMRSVRDASVWIREVVGESAATIAAFDRLPEYATTPSWEALAVYARGEEFFMRQDYESAILEFESALRIDPKFTLVALRRADLLMSQGRHTDGLAQWRAAIRLLGERPVTRAEELNARAMFAFDSGDIEGADRFARTWALEYPRDWRASYYRVVPLILNGRATQALQLLEALRASMPEYGDVYAMMIACHLVLGQTQAARALVPELRKRHRPERAELREGYIRFREGNLPGYLEVLRSLQRSTAYPRAAADAMIREALLLIDCDLPEAAAANIDAFLRARSWAETDSQETTLRLLQSWAEMRSGQTETAVRRVRNVWAKERGPVVAAVAGTIFARAGRPDLAAEVVELCAELGDVPLYVHARHRVLGERARVEGRDAEALEELRRAAALEPRIAHRQYLIEALPPTDPERLELSLNVVRIPWQMLRPPPLHSLGSLSVAVPIVLAATGGEEAFAARFAAGRAAVASMVG